MTTKKYKPEDRRKITVTRDYVNFARSYYGKTFEEVAEALEELRMRYIEYIILHNYEVRFDHSGYITVIRDENDIEYDKRMKQLEKRRASAEKQRENRKAAMSAAEKRERELLKQLKEKYESA